MYLVNHNKKNNCKIKIECHFLMTFTDLKHFFVSLTGGGDPRLYWEAVRGCRTGEEAAQCHSSST